MDIDLDVYLDENYFNGEVKMEVEVRQPGLTQIVFHQKVTSITGIDIVDSANRVINLQFPGPYTTDDYYELLTLNLAGAIPVGNYTIRVSYVGAINVNPIDRGFYKGYYFNSNNQEVAYATTQFQPGNARKAFPCFDEPTFKSRYRLSITRDSRLSPSYSNMDIESREQVGTNRIREIFYPTPIISAYLVAFHVSDFVETEISSTPARPFKIISRPGVIDQHEFAAEIGVRITNVMDDYFAIIYHEMGQGVLMKNDHIALPDFPSGAMENWGMVNYREVYLLYDQRHMNLPNKITIATIMAHELAHKWFGNLVTTFWWGNLWLNESFASFFEYFSAHDAHPAFELDNQFIVDYVHSALSADSSRFVNPMNWTGVATLPSVSAHFSTSSYAKGASVLRMMEHFVGSRNFRTALRYYLRDNAYGVGTNADMYNAFRQTINEDFEFLRDYPNVDVGAVFESWVQNPGSPVVFASLDPATGTVDITQQRYTISGPRPDDIWQIPLTWTTESELNFQNTKPKMIFSTQRTTITVPEGNNWVIFNVGQSGLYRVNYDAETWVRLGNYLKSANRERINKMNRAQIVNDLLFFVRSGDVNSTIAFNVLEFLKNETDYYVWNGAISQLEFINRRFQHLPDDASKAFSDFLLELMENVIQNLGYEEAANEPTSVTLNRMQIMNSACNLGHAGCVADALNKWRAFRNNDNELVNPNYRRYVYCVGLREGDASDYNFLFQKYETSQSAADMVVMLRALGCTKDETSFNHFLRQSITNRKVRIHDRTNLISFGVQGNRENLQLVLNFLYQNFNEIRTEFGGPDRLSTAMNAVSGFMTDFAMIQQYQNWVYANQVALASSFSTGVSAVQTAINNLDWVVVLVPSELGTIMLLPSILFLLLGSLEAIPEEFRSNFEFVGFNSNFGDTRYRLADTVYPITMNVDLDVYLNESRFDGFVRMDIEVREANLQQIAFHQKVQSITTVDIVSANNDVVNLRFPNPFIKDDHFEIVKLNLAGPIPAGNYTITMNYTGIINENPFDGGLYKGYYFNNNSEITYATTQLAPFFARKVFPCFDEPQFKSRYVLSVTRDSNLSHTYSNMPIAQTIPVGADRIREVFHPTPIISAYLIALHISDFGETELSSTDARPFRIISRPDALDQHKWAAETGVRVTNKLDDYLAILYHEMGQGVLMENDHIALPDFTFGAMENWGMVNYREAFLLYDKNNTNLINKIFIATIMAHEMAHKWFGNLVSTFWWSNVWINESFASYFEYFAAHWALPEFELDHQFVVDYVHSALAHDASLGANPMNWTDVASTPTIMAHFSTTSYAKGASVLRMMENFVGFRNFRLALRYYLRDNAYGIGTPDAVYAAFERAISEDFQFLRDYPGIDVSAVFDSWVQNPGSPVVRVEVNPVSGYITVSQQRFLVSGTRPDHIWHIPLTWTHAGAINFNDTRPKLILSTSSTVIENTTNTENDWVIFNIAQSGLYRVNYDDDNWQRIGNYLKGPTRQNIHRLNRAQIVNDLLFFIRSGDVNNTVALDVLDFLRHETDYYVWNAAIGQLQFIHRRFEHMPVAYDAFSAYLLTLLENVIQHLGYDERSTDSTSDILNRMQILNFACNLGHSGCVTDALNKWRAHRANVNELVPVNYRRYVYCVGLREGDASDYDYLFNQYETSENAADMVVILRALGCTKDEASFNHYLRQSIVNRKIRLHDRTSVISFGLQGNPGNLPLVLNFLYQNYAEIRTAYGGPSRLNIAINSVSGFLTNFTMIEEFQTWVYTNQISLAESFNTGSAIVNSTIANLEWGNENVVETYSFILERTASSSTIFLSSTILVLAAMFIQLFH
ncbi:unnamed protein product [Arctia plantaginis]|uniref:Aminopeptidase N n=1 Tax=Arctia plantaginis TaxID=874455 RepID=A0A8S1BNS7_ARCPL|nr:unnamed protein product [Arctia plantaginis]